MRAFFLTILAVILGFTGGLYADRIEPTKSLIAQHVSPLLSRILPSPPEPEPVSPLPLSEEAEALTTAELAAFGIESCFPRAVLAETEDRPWLMRDVGSQGLFDEAALPTPPDLIDYPGLVKIEGIRSPIGTEREHCAAARVSEHWFLTAAHCIIDLDIETASPTYDIIAVTPSGDVRGEDTQVVPITGAVCHSAYEMNRQQYPNDIALFYLEDVSAFENVVIAELETPSHNLIPFDFRQIYVAGWGKNGGTRYLQGGPVALVEPGEAVLIGERIGPRGPNVGDSGAPLYLAREEGPLVVGTLSQVTQDAEQNGDRSIYIRTKSIHEWAMRTMAICEQNDGYVCTPTPPPTAPDVISEESVADSL
ncbi:MAG: S1 family peptidase [Henriciella sp.]